VTTTDRPSIRWWAVLAMGLGAGAAISGVRSAGWLEWADLRLYDAGTAARARGVEASPVTLVRIREEEIRAYGHPVPDAVLARALRNLARAKPRAIGVDLYRDVEVGGDGGRAELAALADGVPGLVFVEKLPEPGVPGVEPPEFARSSDAIGFNDVVTDRDGVQRRGLLMLWDPLGRPSFALALQLALHYLHAEGIALGADPVHPEHLRLGDTSFPPLEAEDGGYAGVDARGYQVLLDLRAGRDSFRSYTLADAIADAIPPDALRDRIAIIGTTASSVKDEFQSALAGGSVPGIALHAHLADQLVRWAHGTSRPMRFWSEPRETAWTLAWSALAALLAAAARRPAMVATGVASAVGLAYGASWILLREDVWVPASAPLAACALSGALVLADATRRARAERAAVMDLFGRYVSGRVADELWERRAEFMDGNRPRSQRLCITAMLSDLSGYTETAEKMDPRELMEWINEYMSAMTQIIEEEHGGFVDDYSGDGIKANFGVPIRREQAAHVERDARTAVRCALAMGRMLEELVADWERRSLPVARMRIGIYTGDAIVGSLGSRARMKYTTVGDTVNTAARLESFAKEEFEAEAAAGGAVFRVLIGGATLRHLGDEFETEYLGEHVLRGRDEPVAIYRVRAERPALGQEREERV
jgi:adenylate cyclase